MNEILRDSVFFGAFITIFFYEIGLFVSKRVKLSIANPLLIADILLIIFLVTFDIDVETYEYGSKYISYLLTPSTICLAVPLYEQIHLLKKNAVPIMAGIISGVLSSLLSVLFLSILFGFSKKEYITFLPKSLTTAIGLGMSEQLGGYVAITAASIIITGILGNIIAKPVCKFFKITNPVAKGVGIGGASHAIGTARALQMGEIEGAMSGLSLAVSGVITVFAAILFTYLYP